MIRQRLRPLTPQLSGLVAACLLEPARSRHYLVLRVYLSFLAYFHEAVGGPAGGGRYVGDSNLDRRLRAFVDAHHTVPIAVDSLAAAR